MVDKPGSSSSAGGNKKKREKKVYSHTMTPAERHAYHAVLNAKNACTQLAVAIQEGKKVDPKVVQQCGDLYANAALMIFAE